MNPFDPVWTLLSGTGFTVYDGHVPDDRTFPYSVLWMPPIARRSINDFAGASGRADIAFRITSVGLTRASVVVIAGEIHDALIDQRIALAGWTTYPIRHRGTDVPIQEDRQVVDPATDRHPLYTVDAYQLAAEKE